MFTVKRIFFAFSAIILVVLLIAPIAALYLISQKEITALTKQEEIVIREVSYGEPKAVFFGDIKNSMTLDGLIVSRDVDFIELAGIAEADKVRFTLHVGDYISDGTVIGYLNGEPVVSDKEGVVREISYGNNGYIMLDSISSLALESFVDVKTAAALSVGTILTDDLGNNFEIALIDGVATNGKIRMLIVSAESDWIYGAIVEQLKLYTGDGYKNVLMVSRDCVYSYPDNESQYVRVVDKNQFFVKEIEVKTWLSDGSYVTISGEGVEEGMLCDSGYKLIAESGSRYE